jgi:aldehyde:ferredoxin oxidoreductase
LGLSPNPMGLGFEPGEVARIFGSKVMDPSSYEDKALSVYYSQGIATIADSIEICKFHTGWCGQVMHLKDMAPLISAVTGMKVDEGGLREIADRIWTTERAFLVREGITRKDDILDGRHRNEPIPSGPFKGGKQDPEKWDKMLDEYYELVGWDKKTGAPTRTKLEELGLGDIAKELQKMAKNPAA